MIDLGKNSLCVYSNNSHKNQDFYIMLPYLSILLKTQSQETYKTMVKNIISENWCQLDYDLWKSALTVIKTSYEDL